MPPGSDDPQSLSAFGIAAVALDQELRRFQILTEAAGRTALDSRRNLERAARAAQEATESHARMGEHMAAFMAALTAARTQNEEAFHALRARREEIAARTNEVNALVEQVAQLGAVATRLNAAIQSIAKHAKEAPGEVSQTVADLRELLGQMDRVLEEAERLAHTARDRQCADIAHDVDGMRQQILAARNKMHLLLEKLDLQPKPAS
jgi:chromosome segregation ATPase